MSNDYPFVQLRALEPEDLDILYRIENDRSLWEVGVTNVPYSRFALREYIMTSTGDIYVDKQVRLMITGHDQEVIGMVDLCNFNPQHGRAEVGIVIDEPYRGKGYSEAALLQLIDYAREVLHIHQLYALMNTGNTSCIRLFEHIGFVHEGVLKDWLYDGTDYHDALILAFFL